MRKEEELAEKRKELREVLGSEEFDQRSAEIRQSGEENQQRSEAPPQRSEVPVQRSVAPPQGGEEIQQRSKEIHQSEDAKRPGKPTGSLEERLTVLKRLRSKDLITEEEYETKRMQILDEL